MRSAEERRQFHRPRPLTACSESWSAKYCSSRLVGVVSLCIFTCASAQEYVVPQATLEALTPRGFRVSIPDSPGVQLFAFHGNLNKPMRNLDAGEMSVDIVTKTGDQWVYYNDKLRLKLGDIINYWTYVQVYGRGYRLDDQTWQVTELVRSEGPSYAVPTTTASFAILPTSSSEDMYSRPSNTFVGSGNSGNHGGNHGGNSNFGSNHPGGESNSNYPSLIGGNSHIAGTGGDISHGGSFGGNTNPSYNEEYSNVNNRPNNVNSRPLNNNVNSRPVNTGVTNRPVNAGGNNRPTGTVTSASRPTNSFGTNGNQNSRPATNFGSTGQNRPTDNFGSNVGQNYRPTDSIGSNVGQNYRPTDSVDSNVGQNYRPTDNVGQNYRPTDNVGQNYRPTDSFGSSNVGQNSRPADNYSGQNNRPTNSFGSGTSQNNRPTNNYGSSTSHNRPIETFSSVDEDFGSSRPNGNVGDIDSSFNRPKPPKPQTSRPSMPATSQHCVLSTTTVNGRPACKNYVIFEETFKNLDPRRWTRDVRIPSQPDFEFCVFSDEPDTLWVQNDALHIRPRLTEDRYGEDFVRTGNLVLEGCTAGPTNAESCSRQAVFSYILPPALSARIHTKDAFRFRYGLLEIRAKLPLGDWIYPEILLLPYQEEYGPGISSGRVQLAMARGNRQLSYPSYSGGSRASQLGAKRLEYGVLAGSAEKILHREANRQWADQFHNYSLLWTPETMAFSVDGVELGIIRPESYGGLLRSRNGQDSWSNGEAIAPFDKEFYLSLGLAVGGVRTFPDDTVTGGGTNKPWGNTDAKAMLRFWEAKQDWFPTWGNESQLIIDSIRVTALNH